MSNAVEPPGGGPPAPSIAPIAAAVAAVVAIITSLAAAGVMQRILRNNGESLLLGLGLVVLGVMGLIAGRPANAKPAPRPPTPPATSPRSTAHRIWGRLRAGFRRSSALLRLVLRPLGFVAVAAGTIVAISAAVLAAGDTERPTIRAAITADGLRVTGEVAVGTLASTERLVVLVDGIGVEDPAEPPLAQAYVGPDAEGKVSMPLDVHIPPGRYTTIGIRAWTAAKPPEECDAPAKEGNVGAACITLPLPRHPDVPRLDVSWEGKSRESKSVKIATSGDNAARVLAVEAVGCCRHMPRVLYRTLSRPGGKAQITGRVPVPADVSTVCVQARYVSEDTEPPPTPLRCPLVASKEMTATAELHRKRAQGGGARSRHRQAR